MLMLNLEVANNKVFLGNISTKKNYNKEITDSTEALVIDPKNDEICFKTYR